MSTPGLPVIRAADIPIDEAPRRWLVEGLWGASAVGLIGGAPKCGKTWLSLDLALSVASGTPCLDRYPVREPGPALVYLAEDALPQVRERILALSRHHGIAVDALDLFIITAPSLRLDLEPDQRRLRETLERFRPRLLVLDPLVRLHRLNENSAAEVSLLLGYLRELQRSLDVAIVLVHHTRKNGASVETGQGLRGSGDFHAWSDSSLYLRRHRDALTLAVEHRFHPPPAPLTLRLSTDDPPHLVIVDRAPDSSTDPLSARVLAALAERPMTRAALRNELGVKNERLGRALEHLEAAGSIERADDGWRLASALPDDSVPRSLL